MSNTVSLRTNCRLCNDSNLALAVHFAPTPVGDAFVSADKLHEVQDTYNLEVMLCPRCGNAQLRNVVNPDIIYRDYYYKTSVSLGLVDHFKQYVTAVVKKLNLVPGSFVVEMGSNEGSILRPFKDLGFKVLGIDPAVAIAQRSTASGIETLPEYFDRELARQIRGERGEAAVVLANNVFANIDDVSNVAEGVKYLLAEDGVFIFETSYWLDVVEKMLIDTVFHEHLTYFAVAPIQRFFASLGMELFDVEHVATKGGSIRCFVQNAKGKRPVCPSVAELITRENKAGLYNLDSYNAYSNRLNTLGSDLRALLTELKGEHKTVAAYGAAVGLTTMIYHFGLGKYIDFIVDDNIDKQNTFSPGLHIPTLAPAAIYERKADFILVLAWRYANTIIGNHDTFHKAGGKYILPLPTLTLV